MKRFSFLIPSAWRNPKKLPIPTHAELVERVAVLMERVARQDVKLGSLERLLGTEGRTGILKQFYADRSGYMIPRAVVMHPTEADLAALEHLKTELGVVQPLQPGEVIAPTPTPVSERPWEREGWCNALGECWWHPPEFPGYWLLVMPKITTHRRTGSVGWLLPHYAIPVISAPEGGQA